MSSLGAAAIRITALAVVAGFVLAFGPENVAASPLSLFGISAGIGKHGDVRRQGLGRRVQPHFGELGVAVVGAAAVPIGLGSAGASLPLRFAPA